MRSSFSLCLVVGILVVLPVQPALSQTGGAKTGGIVQLGVEGNCDEVSIGSNLPGKVLERLSVRPLLSPRDGTQRRRAAIKTIRKTNAGTTLEINTTLNFAGEVSVTPEDLIYSISRCSADAFPKPEIVSSHSVLLPGVSNIEILRSCNLRQASSDAVFGSLAGQMGAYLASGPYEVLNWNLSRIVLIRVPDEGRGANRIELNCFSEPAAAIAQVRSGSLSAAFLAAGSIPPGIGVGDETVSSTRCLSDSGVPYELFTRNHSISCLERMDPLAIIPE